MNQSLTDTLIERGLLLFGLNSYEPGPGIFPFPQLISFSLREQFVPNAPEQNDSFILWRHHYVPFRLCLVHASRADCSASDWFPTEYVDGPRWDFLLTKWSGNRADDVINGDPPRFIDSSSSWERMLYLQAVGFSFSFLINRAVFDANEAVGISTVFRLIGWSPKREIKYEDGDGLLFFTESYMSHKLWIIIIT